MKLCKKICQKCYEQNGYFWNSWFEEALWENGVVNCREGDLISNDRTEIPKECPYVLEHTVLRKGPKFVIRQV